MKRVMKIVFIAILIGITPFRMAVGQEKKSEKKIKVIVNDGGETKILIDTLLSDDFIRDSIKLKDGKYIFIGKSKDDLMSDDDNDHIFVTVSADGKDTDKEIREIEIIKSDASDDGKREEKRSIIVYKGDKVIVNKTGDNDKEMTWSVKEEDGSGENVIIINDGKVLKSGGSGSYTYTIRNDKSVNKDSDTESTKYVIRKDGVVITIEGEDYAKVKKIADELGGKIDNKDESASKKE